MFINLKNTLRWEKPDPTVHKLRGSVWVRCPEKGKSVDWEAAWWLPRAEGRRTGEGLLMGAGAFGG